MSEPKESYNEEFPLDIMESEPSTATSTPTSEKSSSPFQKQVYYLQCAFILFISVGLASTLCFYIYVHHIPSNITATNRKMSLRQLPLKFVKVNCLQDLLNVTGYPTSVDVLSLATPIPTPPPLQPLFHITVSFLRVSGLISEEWLLFLLKEFFTELTSLTLNINGLCKGSAIRDRDSLPPLKHNSIITLNLEEGTMCSILNWVFRLEMEKLKSVVISGVDFNKRTFSSFINFLNNYKGKLDEVHVQKCNFPDECNFTMIPPEINFIMSN